MSEERPALRVDGTGPRPLVVKHATGGRAAARLRHEVEVLRRAQHPGVVSLVDTVDEEDGLVARTRFCGSRTLASASPLPVNRTAGLVAALATTVADLHDLGVAHRRISADHVLIANDGRPVLCGFGEAMLDADAGSCAEDVAGLGALLAEILDGHDDVVPVPASRLGRKGAWTGYQRRALLNLADQASADEAVMRPSARQLAQSIRSTVPDAVLVGPLEASSSPPGQGERSHRHEQSGGLSRLWGDSPSRPGDREPSRRLVTVGAVAAAVVLIITLALAVAIPTGPSEPAALSADRSGSSPSTTSPPLPIGPPSTESNDEWFPDGIEDEAEDAVDAHSVAGVDGATGCSTDPEDPGGAATTAGGTPCPTDLALVDGVLRVAGDEFHLGLTDAVVAVGDFDCAGEAQAAVLDRATGEVFVFDRWADEDRPATANVLEQLDGARRLLAEPNPSTGCHRLVGLDGFGIRHVLESSLTRTEDP